MIVFRDSAPGELPKRYSRRGSIDSGRGRNDNLTVTGTKIGANEENPTPNRGQQHDSRTLTGTSFYVGRSSGPLTHPFKQSSAPKQRGSQSAVPPQHQSGAARGHKIRFVSAQPRKMASGLVFAPPQKAQTVGGGAVNARSRVQDQNSRGADDNVPSLRNLTTDVVNNSGAAVNRHHFIASTTTTSTTSRGDRIGSGSHKQTGHREVRVQDQNQHLFHGELSAWQNNPSIFQRRLSAPDISSPLVAGHTIGKHLEQKTEQSSAPPAKAYHFYQGGRSRTKRAGTARRRATAESRGLATARPFSQQQRRASSGPGAGVWNYAPAPERQGIQPIPYTDDFEYVHYARKNRRMSLPQDVYGPNGFLAEAKRRKQARKAKLEEIKRRPKKPSNLDLQFLREAIGGGEDEQGIDEDTIAWLRAHGYFRGRARSEPNLETEQFLQWIEYFRQCRKEALEMPNSDRLPIYPFPPKAFIFNQKCPYKHTPGKAMSAAVKMDQNTKKLKSQSELCDTHDKVAHVLTDKRRERGVALRVTSSMLASRTNEDTGSRRNSLAYIDSPEYRAIRGGNSGTFVLHNTHAAVNGDVVKATTTQHNGNTTSTYAQDANVPLTAQSLPLAPSAGADSGSAVFVSEMSGGSDLVVTSGDRDHNNNHHLTNHQVPVLGRNETPLPAQSPTNPSGSSSLAVPGGGDGSVPSPNLTVSPTAEDLDNDLAYLLQDQRSPTDLQSNVHERRRSLTEYGYMHDDVATSRTGNVGQHDGIAHSVQPLSGTGGARAEYDPQFAALGPGGGDDDLALSSESEADEPLNATENETKQGSHTQQQRRTVRRGSTRRRSLRGRSGKRRRGSLVKKRRKSKTNSVSKGK